MSNIKGMGGLCYMLLVVAVLCICPLPTASERSRNFIVTAPSRFGSREGVCITLAAVPANVSISLLDWKSDSPLSAPVVKLVTEAYDCFEIRLAVVLHEPITARLFVRVSLPDEGEIINSIRNVTLAPDPLLTFITTDKPIYGSKQLIRIRIFSVGIDFQPVVDENMMIWLENPQGVRIMQWRDIKHVGGFADLSYHLVENPYPGAWTVKAKIRGNEHARRFHVQKLSQTTFQVQLGTPDTADENSKINISVCAKYAFKKPVIGEVQLNVTVECPFAYYCSENSTTESLAHSLDDTGCAEMTITVEAGKQSLWRNLLVEASVQEEGTKQVQSNKRKITIIPASSFNSVVSEFKLRTRRIKPGLPFEGKLLLSTRRKPVVDTDVTFCTNLEGAKLCKVGRTSNGTVPFVMLSRQKLVLGEKVLLEVSWTDNSKETKRSLYLQPWYSPSGAYLQIKTNAAQLPLQCGGLVKVQVLHTMHSNLKFYVVVKSRGSIMLFDTIEEMKELEVADFTYDAVEDSLILADGQPADSIESISFTLQVNNSWSPSAHLIIYTVLEDGDVVADSANLPIEECFLYEISSSWNTNETVPGSDVDLKISADRPSTCAVTVVDKEVEMLSSHLPKLKEELFLKLKEVIQTDRRRILSSNGCVSESVEATPQQNNLSVMPEPTSAYADSANAFEDSDILVMSDLPLAVKPCRQPIIIDPRVSEKEREAQEALSAVDVEDNFILDVDRKSFNENLIPGQDPEVTVRSNFLDTWIFDLYYVKDKDMRVPVTMPDSLTEWTAQVSCMASEGGLSVARPTTIRSFQPFFLDFSFPPSVKRHELIYLPISVFNYMDSSVPVMIYVEPSEHFHIKGELSKSVCVGNYSKVTQIFRLLAVKLGEANVSIKAEIDPFSAEECGPPLNDYKVDYVMKKTTVRGEGRRLEEIRSALICGSETRIGNSSYPNSVDWTMKMSSPDYVDHTVNAEARVSGDVFGPPLLNVDKYILLPTGCGEQNMLSFSINVLLVKYLLAKHRGSGVEARDTAHVTKALTSLDAGYQQQLSFRHPDGSYSAFGPESSNSSIWLTAFVVRYFTEAKLYIRLDEDHLNQSVQWLRRQQLENGCFPMLGDVYHWDAKRRLAAFDSPKALTSYILISILKGNLSASTSLVKNAVFCLQASDVEDIYADLLAAYALTIANETRVATSTMKGLLETAQRSYQMLWWQAADGPSAETSIEMTSYGVLALLKLGGPHFLAASADAVRWLLQYQNENGGFISTQDTVVALEALAEYSDLLPRQAGSSSVSLSYLGGNNTFEINESNQQIQQISLIPPFLTSMHFEVSGSGCALVQAILSYNVRRGAQSKSLKLQMKVEPVSSVDGTIRKIEVCAKTKASLASTGMAIIQITLPTGYFPDRTSLYHITASQKGVMKWEEFEDYVNFYLESLTHQKKCFMFLIKREVCVENPSSVIAKVYDYYNSMHFSAVKHNIQQTCNNTDAWLQSENTIREINLRHRRDVKPSSGGGLFSNFMEVDQDLDVPTDNGNPVQVFALPPPPVNEVNYKCPQCFAAPQELFAKLYCSSKLAAQIQMRGPHLLDILQDLSPGRTSNGIRRTIAYTMKRRCKCDIVQSGVSTAFLMVTPPRFFNIRTVQVIHLDDSFAIFPWNVTSQFQNTYFNISFSCNEMLSIVR